MFDFSSELTQLGLTPFFVRQLHEAPEGALGRIACERRGEYDVTTAEGSRRAILSGRLLHELADDDFPTVGDWVVLQHAEPLSRIEHVLERQNVLRRAAVGGTSRAQNLAANVDLCCVVAAFSAGDVRAQRRSLNERRIQRYLTTAEMSRVPTLVLLNKADVVPMEEAEQARQQLLDALPGARAQLVSAHTGLGLDALREELPRGASAVLLGSSGVGKSTLVNALLGQQAQRTSAERAGDARGRHTTTERQLLALQHGALLIDTPGMRELALWADGESDSEASTSFSDVHAFAASCRFRDCSHGSEPGCAVAAAIEAGALSARRLEEMRKLERELAYQGARVDARLRQERADRWKMIGKVNRQRQRTSGKT